MNRTSKLKVPLLDDATLSPQVAWQDAFNRVEKGMLGESVISVSGADQTLVGDQARYQIFTVEGMDEVPRSLVLPVGVDAARPHIVRNTTGQTLTVKTTDGASVGVALPANSNQYIYNTGTEIIPFTTGLGNAESIAGIPVSTTPPEEGQVYSVVDGVLTPVDFPTGGGGGGGGGATVVVSDTTPVGEPDETFWFRPGGSSGGGNSGDTGPDTPPSSPSEWDDEFSVDGVLNPDKWMLWNLSAIPMTHEVSNGSLRIAFGAGGGFSHSGYRQIAPAGNFIAYAKLYIQMAYPYSEFNQVNIKFWGSNGKSVSQGTIHSGNNYRSEYSHWNGVMFDDFTRGVPIGVNPMYVAMERRGNDIIAYTSVDGYQWAQSWIDGNVIPAYLGDVAYIGLNAGRNAQADGMTFNAAWFRVKELN